MKYKNEEKYYIYFEKKRYEDKKNYETLNEEQLNLYEERCDLVIKHKKLAKGIILQNDR